VVTAVLSGQHLSATYQEIVDGVAAVFETENVTLELPDPGTEDLVIVAAAGPLSSALRTGELSSTGPDATARFELGALGTGMITAARSPDREPFHPGEVELLSAVGRQLALAVQLGEARADQQRLAVLEERQRLAQDLHDTVIQDLIAIGMQLHVDVQQIEDQRRQEGFLTVLEHLDAAIRRLRSTVFGLTAPDLDR
jgi:signal transduction histidine kinase